MYGIRPCLSDVMARLKTNTCKKLDNDKWGRLYLSLIHWNKRLCVLGHRPSMFLKRMKTWMAENSHHIYKTPYLNIYIRGFLNTSNVHWRAIRNFDMSSFFALITCRIWMFENFFIAVKTCSMRSRSIMFEWRYLVRLYINSIEKQP